LKSLFVKKAPTNLIEAELDGLLALQSLDGISIPKIDTFDLVSGEISMDRIEGTPTGDSFRLLGRMMAKLHQATKGPFGWKRDNYIGQLHQINRFESSWSIFWIKNRLEPQFKLALKKNLLGIDQITPMDSLEAILEEVITDKTPCLIHGDFWRGNFLVDSHGNPYLIDPSIYIGVGGVDMAMSRLFGGFDQQFYKAYYEHRDIERHSEKELQVYQLYYLLVHLNMFGSAYLNDVIKTMRAVGI